MRKIFIKYGTGYCGEDDASVFEFENDVTDEVIEQTCQDITTEWMESFGREEYEDMYWHWENYSSKDHDMYRAGGGSFKEDFE